MSDAAQQVVDGLPEPDPARPPSRHAYSRVCAWLSKISLMLAVVLLIAIIVCVQYQVVGRYLFNDTPVWAEGLALQLVLYVTALGVAIPAKRRSVAAPAMFWNRINFSLSTIAAS